MWASCYPRELKWYYVLRCHTISRKNVLLTWLRVYKVRKRVLRSFINRLQRSTTTIMVILKNFRKKYIYRQFEIKKFSIVLLFCPIFVLLQVKEMFVVSFVKNRLKAKVMKIFVRMWDKSEKFCIYNYTMGKFICLKYIIWIICQYK